MSSQPKSSSETVNARAKMGKDEIEASLRLLDSAAAILIALVAIGVAGELVVHILESRKSKELSSIQSAESEQLKLQIASLTNANLQLQAKIAPRALTVEQQKEIGQTLGDPLQIDIFMFSETPESKGIGMQIYLALLSAKWDVSIWRVLTPGRNFPGIAITTHKGLGDRKWGDAANSLISILRSSGIQSFRSETFAGAIDDNEAMAGWLGFSVEPELWMRKTIVWDEGKAAPIRILIGDKP
jgi:hypothetical protein